MKLNLLFTSQKPVGDKARQPAQQSESPSVALDPQDTAILSRGGSSTGKVARSKPVPESPTRWTGTGRWSSLGAALVMMGVAALPNYAFAKGSSSHSSSHATHATATHATHSESAHVSAAHAESGHTAPAAKVTATPKASTHEGTAHEGTIHEAAKGLESPPHLGLAKVAPTNPAGLKTPSTTAATVTTRPGIMGSMASFFGLGGTTPAKPSIDHSNDGSHPIKLAGQEYHIPAKGWVTPAHQKLGDIQTVVVGEHRFHESGDHNIFTPRTYYRGVWGDNWSNNPRGYYSHDNFWLGFLVGRLTSHNYVQQPVYIYSPSTDWQGPQILPPNGAAQFDNDAQAQLAVLKGMISPQGANPGAPIDPTAGLYRFDDKFHPDEAHPTYPEKLATSENAYNLLRKDQALLFHPPQGDWVKLETLDDLRIYIAEKQPKGSNTGTW